MTTASWTISIIAIAIVVVLAIRWERNTRRAGGSERRLDPDDPTRAHEFMSPAWVVMAKREITTALSGHPLDVTPFTLSEEFTDPPGHLRRGGDTIGFSVRVGGGKVEVGDLPVPTADCRVISNYDDALTIARDPDARATDPTQVSERIADGRLRIEGDPTRMPAVLQELDIHRLLAAHTA